MIKNKNIPLIIGMTMLFAGSFLPSIKIAQENISFIKENGSLIIILIAIMVILLKLDKKTLITIPSTLSLTIIIKFIIDNKTRLQQIIETYNCYAKFQYGLILMIISNIIIILTILLPLINIETIKEKLRSIILNQKEKHNEKKQSKQQIKQSLTPSLIEKLTKKENKISKETTKDGKIKYNKIVVKVDKPIKEKQTLKQRISDTILKLKIKKISIKKLSVTKYNEETNKKTYYIPTINIKKWTRSNISCINCGATIKTNSEYCFLCDCKINLTEQEGKLS